MIWQQLVVGVMLVAMFLISVAFLVSENGFSMLLLWFGGLVLVLQSGGFW